jgi:DNA mismatch endonuclease, patch repair protein
MTDVFSKSKRSHVMSKIRSHGNKDTELRLIQIFKRHRVVGWRRNQKIHGNPDFLFRRARVAIFVDGCFWHGCRTHFRLPRSNILYWKKKIGRNIRRDRNVNRILRSLGWGVVRIWEHELGQETIVICRIVSAITGRSN